MRGASAPVQMQRDLTKFTQNVFDVVVVGGGIHGAFIAWDAALRGLSVALLEKGDFGGATSANSLKTVHGGLRYLQDADPGLVRMMIRERRNWLRIAPHLVHPLPILMPTYPGLMKSKAVMALAVKLNDLIGFDRNAGIDDPGKAIPPGRVVSREECLKLLPGVAQDGISGGVIWYDAQIYNTERATLSVVLSAEQRGAAVANYLEADRLIQEGGRVAGVEAVDRLSGDRLAVRSRVVVNSAGPWVDQVLSSAQARLARKFRHSVAMNLVTRKFIQEYAAGVLTMPVNAAGERVLPGKGRVLFISPWREYSLVGTYHTYTEGEPDDFKLNEADIQTFIDEANSAYPGAELRREEVCFIHRGFLPAAEDGQPGQEVKLIRAGQISDHRQDGIEGLITAVGVKFTSSRQVAQRAVDQVFRLLGARPPECETDRTPIYGGEIERFEDYLREQKGRGPAGLSQKDIEALVRNYGTAYPQVRDLIAEESSGRFRALKAETLHAVRNEMAVRLSDVILRRTELGSAGPPDSASVAYCAGVMAEVLGWDEARQEAEIQAVVSHYLEVT